MIGLDLLGAVLPASKGAAKTGRAAQRAQAAGNRAVAVAKKIAKRAPRLARAIDKAGKRALASVLKVDKAARTAPSPAPSSKVDARDRRLTPVPVPVFVPVPPAGRRGYSRPPVPGQTPSARVPASKADAAQRRSAPARQTAPAPAAPPSSKAAAAARRTAGPVTGPAPTGRRAVVGRKVYTSPYAWVEDNQPGPDVPYQERQGNPNYRAQGTHDTFSEEEVAAGLASVDAELADAAAYVGDFVAILQDLADQFAADDPLAQKLQRGIAGLEVFFGGPLEAAMSGSQADPAATRGVLDLLNDLDSQQYADPPIGVWADIAEGNARLVQREKLHQTTWSMWSQTPGSTENVPGVAAPAPSPTAPGTTPSTSPADQAPTPWEPLQPGTGSGISSESPSESYAPEEQYSEMEEGAGDQGYEEYEEPSYYEEPDYYAESEAEYDPFAPETAEYDPFAPEAGETAEYDPFADMAPSSDNATNFDLTDIEEEAMLSDEEDAALLDEGVADGFDLLGHRGGRGGRGGGRHRGGRGGRGWGGGYGWYGGPWYDDGLDLLVIEEDTDVDELAEAIAKRLREDKAKEKTAVGKGGGGGGGKGGGGGGGGGKGGGGKGGGGWKGGGHHHHHGGGGGGGYWGGNLGIPVYLGPWYDDGLELLDAVETDEDDIDRLALEIAKRLKEQRTLIGAYDIQQSQRQMNTLKDVTIAIARAMVRNGKKVAQQTIAMAEGSALQRTLPGVTSLKKTLGHVQWHEDNLEKFSDPTAIYPNSADLKKWVMQSFIDANSVEEARAMQEVIWNAMWTEIGEELAKMPAKIVAAIVKLPGQALELVTGIPSWVWWVGGGVLVFGVGLAAWKLITLATPVAAAVAVRRIT